MIVRIFTSRVLGMLLISTTMHTSQRPTRPYALQTTILPSRPDLQTSTNFLIRRPSISLDLPPHSATKQIAPLDLRDIPVLLVLFSQLHFHPHTDLLVSAASKIFYIQPWYADHGS